MTPLESQLRMQTRVWKNFQPLFSAFLLLIYVWGAISVDVLHHSLHSHHKPEAHSSIIEQDPCHRAIFHGDTKEGCHHKTHFTNAEKCKYSYVLFQAQQLLTPDNTGVAIGEDVLNFVTYQPSLVPSSTALPNLRGPPLA